MYFFKALLVCASLVASALSQTTSSRIAFTVLPSTMTAGQDITLHWGGGDGSKVTITLQKGTTDNLQTVQLVTGDATGTSYTWSVPKSLPNADNYAFRIQQGDTEPNYTGMITATGGSSSSASASASTTKSSSGGVIGGASKSAASNSTILATATANATTTAVAGTAASASGTGFSMSRNITMSKATLSSTTTSASSTSRNPSVGGSSGTPTGSTSAPSSSKTGGAVALAASNFALLVCAVAGVIYLG